MVTAMTLGVCVVCLHAYVAGEEVGLAAEGWAHVECWHLVMGQRFGAAWTED